MAERFDGNPKLIEKFVFQDEKEFTLKVQTKHSKTKNGTIKPFFVNGCEVKVNWIFAQDSAP